MKTILVTGGKGQLAQCLRDVTENLVRYSFIYVDYDVLDITNKENIKEFFINTKIDYCINCAAYTAVDKAEDEPEIAKKVNENGVKNLAEVCKKNNTVLIHISTDFVFDGKESLPYKEDDKTNPLSFYGQTKLNGEIAVSSVLDDCFIIRTSWLYSEYGNNYLKTMLKLAKVKNKLNIIYDQIGTPTYARDLATFIVKLIVDDSKMFGTYHYSNEGVAGWYDFTKAIFSIKNIKLKVNPIKTEEYQQNATRPRYSVLDKSKIKKTFKIEIPYWVDSLKLVLKKFN